MNLQDFFSLVTSASENLFLGFSDINLIESEGSYLALLTIEYYTTKETATQIINSLQDILEYNQLDAKDIKVGYLVQNTFISYQMFYKDQTTFFNQIVSLDIFPLILLNISKMWTVEQEYGVFSCPHTIWGVLDEEMIEFKNAVKDNNDLEATSELTDIIAAAMLGQKYYELKAQKPATIT